jgi:hypothetical protein
MIVAFLLLGLFPWVVKALATRLRRGNNAASVDHEPGV